MREVAVIKDGPKPDQVVWDEEYHFSRLSAPGDVIIRDSIQYVVVSCKKVDDTIHTVLRCQGKPK